MNDDDFAQHLRARLDEVMPPVTVHTAHVVPRARRRRARIRSLQAVGAVGALAVVGAAADGLSGRAAPWQDVAPATTSPAPDPVPTTQATPAPQETPGPVDQSVGPREESAVAAGRYWYTRTVTTWGSETEVNESWKSRTEPGLLVADGDLTTPAAMGPVDVIGRFRIDGQWVDMLRDPALLPTDGDRLGAVLRASLEPDRRQGSDDDKVFAMAQELLRQGLLLPEPLLQAAWAVAADVAGLGFGQDGVAGRPVFAGNDSAGRLGEVVHYLGSDGTVRLTRDPATGLLLEEVSDELSTLYEVQEFTDAIPLEPTLEMSGCTAWESC